MTPQTALGPGPEFDIIRELLARLGGSAAGIGDDAALLTVPGGERLVVSTDTAVEDVHFRREWLTPKEIGFRATVAALSDLAAMGAAPLGVLVGLSAPRGWIDDLPHVAEGIGEAATVAGVRVVGGDLTAARDLTIAVTVLGTSAAPVERRGARPGDSLYVTGTLGGARSALLALQAGRAVPPAARERFTHPLPRIAEGIWLAQHGARAMIDISDGLLGDVAHLAAASGVHMVLDLADLPTTPGTMPLDAAVSGEEYELLAVAPAPLDVAGFACSFGIPLTRIGRVERGSVGVDAYVHGQRVASPGGFNHFM
ncbi:MAG TPA: thiamine-phosphate kinase [Gemmatimonadaceae bacterium]|nr:thiamine-phosphate kinase [Gemmatimonadaceae bacterium]